MSFRGFAIFCCVKITSDDGQPIYEPQPGETISFMLQMATYNNVNINNNNYNTITITITII